MIAVERTPAEVATAVATQREEWEQQYLRLDRSVTLEEALSAFDRALAKALPYGTLQPYFTETRDEARAQYLELVGKAERRFWRRLIKHEQRRGA